MEHCTVQEYSTEHCTVRSTVRCSAVHGAAQSVAQAKCAERCTSAALHEDVPYIKHCTALHTPDFHIAHLFQIAYPTIKPETR